MEDLKIIQLYWEREESAIIQTKEKYGKTMEQLAYRLLFDYQDTEECWQRHLLGLVECAPT